MKPKKTVAIIAGILFITVLIHLLNKELWDANEKLLKEKILAIEHSVETIDLLDVTPFEWEVVYSFDPYTPKEMVYETVGYKWDRISETVSEGMNQIVFMKEGKVVCYLYGYPENNGYGLYFSGENVNGVSQMLTANEDDLTFQVKRDEGFILLY
ncbi:hypothetical protein [Alkalihalobacterium elongatum]|uniref:hypothetical protein n=1 Tax=Alkalihalobacterium elongatum TaxID=2675466 RepID=UPI001C1F688A|nr:hypothetical protein [Alkalihalobacterium elongatum]